MFLFLLTLVAIPHQVVGNFRGALITWRSVDNYGKIEITYRVGWRLGASPHNLCMSKPTNQNEGSSSIYFRFRDGQILPIRKAVYFCNADVSRKSDWLVGQNTFQYQLPPELKRFDIGFNGCCWKGITGLNNTKAKWMVWTRVDVTKQHINQDGSKVVNSSPVTTFQPFVYTITGCQYSFKIPVFDADDDITRCRFAKYSTECDDACTNLPNVSLDEDGCILRFKAPTSTGRYIVALQIEDFNEVESTVPKSSVGLQFVVMVSKNRFNQSCQIKPSFVEEKNGGYRAKCLRGKIGESIRLEMTAKSQHKSDKVTEILTSSPVLSNATSLDMGHKDGYKKVLYWVPMHAGYHFVCFVALTKYGRSSAQYCQLIMVGDMKLNRNRILNINPEPGSIVPINIHQITIKFRRTIKLHPADQIDALLYDVNYNTVAKVIKRNDVTIVNSTILVIHLSEFVRDYVKKYRLIAQRLVKSDPVDFCISQPLIQYVDFVMTSERDPVTVECQKDGFTVSISKSFFTPYQVKKAHLHQSKCQATFNSSHMILSSKYSECWTRVIANITHVTYTNFFQYEIDIPSFRYNEKISKKRQIICTLKRMFPSEDVVVDDDDSLVDNHVAALYLVPQSAIGRILVTFEMFLDENFVDKYQPYEFPLKLEERKNLFFQIILSTTHTKMKIVLDTCYTKTETIMNQWNGSQKYFFVQNRCGNDDSFTMLNVTTNQVLRFSLNPTYIEHFSKDVGLYFHCEVTLCRTCRFGCKDNKTPNVRRRRSLEAHKAVNEEVSLEIGTSQVLRIRNRN